MSFEEFKRRCGNLKQMPGKDIAFVLGCFVIAIVMLVLWLGGEI